MIHHKFIIFLNLLSTLLLGAGIIVIGCKSPSQSSTVVITSATWTATPTEQQLITNLAKAFEAQHPEIKVRTQIIPNDYLSKILTSISANQGPDCFWAATDLVRSLVKQRAIIDLTPYIAADKLDTDDFYPTLLEPFVINGKFYGMPNDACTLALFYNKDLFDKEHLSYPDESWTWQNFLVAAQKLTKDFDNDGIIDQWGFNLSSPIDRMYSFIYQNGGQVIDSNNPNILRITEPPAIEAIKFYTDIAFKYHAAPAHGQAADLDAAKAFQLGRLAMLYSGWWDMADTDKHAPKLRYGIAPLPQNKKRGTVDFAVATVMAKSTKHPKETWEFIKFMTGKEGQLIRCKSGMAGPSRKSVAQDAFFQGKNKEKVFIDGFDYGKTFYGEYAGIADDELRRAFERVMLKQQTVEKSFNEAVNNYEKRKKSS